MRAKIYDLSMRYLYSFTGTYSEGVFKYKEGGLLGIGAETKNLNCDYAKLIEDKNEKVAYYIYDGKNYTQVTLSSMNEKSTSEKDMKDYLTYTEITQMRKAQALTKPFDLKQIIEILWFVLLTVTMITMYFFLQGELHGLATVYAPANATANQNAVLIHILLNKTAQEQNMYNATLRALQQLSTSNSSLPRLS